MKSDAMSVVDVAVLEKLRCRPSFTSNRVVARVISFCRSVRAISCFRMNSSSVDARGRNDHSHQDELQNEVAYRVRAWSGFRT